MSSKESKPKKSSPAPPLNFINVNATSAAERAMNKRTVRSHAMRHFHQRSQAKTSNGIRLSTGAAVEKQRASAIQSSSPLVARVPPQESSDGLACRTRHQVGNFNHRSPETPLNLGIEESNNGNRNEASAGVKMLLVPSQGSRDPFRQYPVPIVGDYIEGLLDYATKFKWPGLQISTESNTTPYSLTCLQHSLTHSMSYHSLLLGVLAYQTMIRAMAGVTPSRAENSRRLYHKLQTIRLVNEQLSHVDEDSFNEFQLDGLIFGICGLGSHEIEPDLIRCGKSLVRRAPFQAPLAEGGLLSYYGAVKHDPTHLAALKSLIERRGGLETLKTGNLAEVLSYCEIIWATRNLCKPFLPLVTRQQSILSSYQLAKSSKWPSLLSSSGLNTSNNAFMSAPLADFLTPEARICYSLMVDSVHLIEDFTSGSPGAPSQVELVERRNILQHHLLCIPSDDILYGSGIDPKTAPSKVYEGVRLAVLLFAVSILFPMPMLSGTLERAVKKLKRELESNELWGSLTTMGQNTDFTAEETRGLQACLLWMLVLGGIGAEDTPQRIWFVRCLRALVCAMGIQSWRQVHSIMRSYLWLNMACESGGMSLWREVQGL